MYFDSARHWIFSNGRIDLPQEATKFRRPFRGRLPVQLAPIEPVSLLVGTQRYYQFRSINPCLPWSFTTYLPALETSSRENFAGAIISLLRVGSNESYCMIRVVNASYGGHAVGFLFPRQPGIFWFRASSLFATSSSSLITKSDTDQTMAEN